MSAGSLGAHDTKCRRHWEIDRASSKGFGTTTKHSEPQIGRRRKLTTQHTSGPKELLGTRMPMSSRDSKKKRVALLQAGALRSRRH